MHKRPVIGGWASVRMRRRRGLELQLFALLGRFQPQKNLQLSLIPLHFVRPVTPKIAGSSPVAPGISINDLARASCSDCNFLAPQSCNFFALDGGALAATEARGGWMRLTSFSEASACGGRAGLVWRRIADTSELGIREREPWPSVSHVRQRASLQHLDGVAAIPAANSWRTPVMTASR